MIDSKVVDSIRLLSPDEKADFSLFLLSPYFHRGYSVEELKGFYDLILAALRSRKQPLTKESVHQKIFPGKPFAMGRLDRLMFELNRLVNVFLQIKHYQREENEVQQMLDLAAVLRSKGQASRLEKQNQKIKKDKTTALKESVEGYFSRYLIALEEHTWHSTYNKVKGDLGVPDVITNLDLFYFSQRLEILNHFLLQQRATSLEIPDVIQLALSAPPAPRFYLDQSPVLLITEKIHDLLRQPAPAIAGFEDLVSLLKAHEAQLSPEALLQFYTYLRNYCAILIDLGNTELDMVLHEIHRDNLARGYFYHEGKIQPNAVLNIIQLAIRAKNIGWARQFLQDHKDLMIGENDTRDFYRMNEALCLFAERQFEPALEIIPFGSTYSSYHLMARWLELKIYYELDSTLLPSKLEAFRMFVRRAGATSFSPTLLELYTNFGNFVHQLVQSIPGDKKRSEQLLRRIQAKELVAERGWLLEKAANLAPSK